MMRKSWLPAYVALGITWGCSFIFIELGLKFLTPFGVAFGRCILGAITLLLVVKVSKIKLPSEKSVWQKLWIVAMLLNVVPGVLFAFAQQYVTSVLAGIINATTPLMTLIFMLILFREEKLKREQILGLLIGAFGVMVVLGVWKGVGENQLLGVVALLVAVACYGYSFPYTTRKILPLGLKPEAAAAMQLSMAAITLLPLYLINGISKDYYPPGSVLAMLALGILGSGFAYIWNFSIIAAAGSSIASSVTYVTPVVAVFVGWLFLAESITWHEPVGAVFVILGAAISQGRFKSKVVS
jgi:drug/metabolite transporter (DMT)-like permease